MSCQSNNSLVSVLPSSSSFFPPKDSVVAQCLRQQEQKVLEKAQSVLGVLRDSYHGGVKGIQLRPAPSPIQFHFDPFSMGEERGMSPLNLLDAMDGDEALPFQPTTGVSSEKKSQEGCQSVTPLIDQRFSPLCASESEKVAQVAIQSEVVAQAACASVQGEKPVALPPTLTPQGWLTTKRPLAPEGYQVFLRHVPSVLDKK